MSTMGNELKMLWVVMQDGESLTAGVDEPTRASNDGRGQITSLMFWLSGHV